jgi:DNA-binding PadR family transcriptional regulator
MTHVDPAGVGPVEELPATSWAVLGLLSFGRELTGYDVKKWADASLRFFYWSPAISQVYAELRRLERVGYAAGRAVAQDQFRSKRVYTITPAGRDALARWVERSPVETPVLKHGVALRIWLGHVADPERLRDIVTHHRE